MERFDRSYTFKPIRPMSNKVVPFLWFNNNVEEAVTFYTSVFKDSEIIHLNKMNSVFRVNGQELYAFNGGPHFTFTEAISLFINCDTQEEVDYYWEALSKGGEKSRCGWLKDSFGLSWQVVPAILGKLMNDPDPVKSKRVVDALMQMTKLDIAALEQAYKAS